MKKTLVIGHRGTAHLGPQNTKAAFLIAKDCKADEIETDLQLTLDNKIVINHNWFIDDNSNGSGAVCSLTYDELSKYDYGAYKDEKFKGEKILTLEELLEIVKDFKIINLELKSRLKKEYPFAKTAADTVDKMGLTDKVIFSSFDVDLMRQIKQYNPKFKVGILTMPDHINKRFREMGAYFLSAYPVADPDAALADINKDIPWTRFIDELDFKPDCFHPDYHSVLNDEHLVEEMHKRGLKVNPYTCDDPEDMKKLIAAGCDGIISNRPDILYKVVNGEI